MAVEFIKEDELLTTFEEAKKFMLPLFQPFDEYERIARNKPHPGIAKELPKVTDGTLAAIIQEQPKRIIQQIPTGKVEADDDWLEVVAGFIFQHEIIPNSDNVAALIQKCWAAISKVLTYGSQPALVQFLHRGDYFGTDFTLPYVKDVLYEPGKLSDRDSNIIFLRTWWTKAQLRALIDKHKMLKTKADERGEQYDAGWDIGKLEQLLEEGTKQKDALQMTPNERDKQLNNGFYEIVHCFQRGIGATFYSFAPALDKDGGDNIVRRKKNPDPRGLIPIHTMYANIDLSNPLGRGSVEMSGGMQNLLDSEVQSYQYMRALLMNPPLKVRGTVLKSTIKYAPHALWDMGPTSPDQSDVEPVSLETKSLEAFPNNYGLIKSQILNLNSGGQDNAVSAQAGDPQSSKTDSGVKAQAARLGISDNYMRKQFESWFSEIAETEINLYFAERQGTQELQLDDETAMKLKKIDPAAVSPDNKIRIDYSTVTPKLKFQVDASSSSMTEDQEQFDAATRLLELCKDYPNLDSKVGGPIDINELADRAVAASGIEDPEKVVVKPEIDPQTGQPVQQPQGMQPEQVQAMIEQAMKQQQKPLSEQLKATVADFPEDARILLIQEMLRSVGVNWQPQPGTVTPAAQNEQIAAQDAATGEAKATLDAVDLAHQHANMQHQQSIAASDAATRVASLQQGENQMHQEAAENAASRDFQAQEAKATREHQSSESAETRKAQAQESEANRKAQAQAAKAKQPVGAK